MAKQDIYQPSEAELEILHIIWDKQPVSVRDIHEIITLSKDVGYTTVLKQIQRLTEKGVLHKAVVDGVHLYSANLQENDAKSAIANKVLTNTFGGSALQMMMHALGGQKTTKAELEALKQWLDQQMDEQ
jgi:BlaI family transcriptional regulator, penicillinase repressor